MSVVLQEISRRELRKALERQGITTLREEEVLVLCDSLDPERRGRVHLSDVRDSLTRGAAVTEISSECEVQKFYFGILKGENYRKEHRQNQKICFAAGRRK